MSGARAVWEIDAHPEVQAGMARLQAEIGRWVDTGQPLDGPVYERYRQAHRAMGAICYRLGYGWSHHGRTPEEIMAAEWPADGAEVAA